MNILQKILYFFLQMQEKHLSKKLSKHLKASGSNSTSKMIFSGSETVTLNSETEKNIKLVKQNVSDIVKSCEFSPEKLVQYIQAKGTKVVRIDNADKLLSAINEEEGLVTSLEGLEALYINIITKSGFSLKSEPVFIMRNGEIDQYYMIHQFYKWYSLKMKLPGFDYLSQKIFKIYFYSNNAKYSNLNLDEMIGLKEAVARDKEATDFALEMAKIIDGSKNVLKKISDGGANI